MQKVVFVNSLPASEMKMIGFLQPIYQRRSNAREKNMKHWCTPHVRKKYVIARTATQEKKGRKKKKRTIRFIRSQ